jgi:hypothetical protein
MGSSTMIRQGFLSLALLLGLSAPSAAQSPAPAPAPAHRYDIRRYGAAPGEGADMAANAHAIQAALDAAHADLVKNGGIGSYHSGLKAEVFIPPLTEGFHLTGPVYLDGNVGLRGEAGSYLSFRGGTSGLLVGVKRLDPADEGWVDAFGLLDATAAPAPGKLYAIDLAGKRFVSFRASPFDLGPPRPHPDNRPTFFDRTDRLTIEYAFKVGPKYIEGPIAGSSRFNGPPSPFVLRYNPNYQGKGLFTLTFMGRADDRTTIAWPVDPDAVQKGAIVLDFAHAKAQAYSHKTGAVPVAFWATGSTWKPGFRLARPLLGEFGVGMTNSGSEGARDFTIAGLKLIDRLRYPVEVAPGTPAVRNDGLPRNDRNSFVDATAGDFAAMVPAASAAGNDGLAAWHSSPTDHAQSGGYGLIRLNDRYDWLGGSPVTGLRIEQASNHAYGSAVMMGLSYDFHLQDCGIYGFARGIDQMVWNTCYTTRVKDCAFYHQSDASVVLGYGISEFSHLDVYCAGRSLFRMHANEFAISDVFGGDERPEAAAEFYEVFTTCSVARFGIDLETSQSPWAFRVGRGSLLQHSGLRLTDVNTGGIEDGGVSIELVKGGPDSPFPAGSNPATLILDNAGQGGINPNQAGIVRLDDPGWAVEVRGNPRVYGGPGQPPLIATTPLAPTPPVIAPEPAPTPPVPVPVPAPEMAPDAIPTPEPAPTTGPAPVPTPTRVDALAALGLAREHLAEAARLLDDATKALGPELPAPASKP